VRPKKPVKLTVAYGARSLLASRSNVGNTRFRSKADMHRPGPRRLLWVDKGQSWHEPERFELGTFLSTADAVVELDVAGSGSSGWFQECRYPPAPV
jgi:hypothetical protein